MSDRTIEIRMPDPDRPSARGSVVVDGHDISHVVSAVSLDADARASARPTVTLTLRSTPTHAFVGSPADVQLTDDERSALVALGWTPPAR